MSNLKIKLAFILLRQNYKVFNLIYDGCNNKILQNIQLFTR